MKQPKKTTKADEAKRRLIAAMIEEAKTGPYVHEECGDTMWEDALAENEKKLAKKDAK